MVGHEYPTQRGEVMVMSHGHERQYHPRTAYYRYDGVYSAFTLECSEKSVQLFILLLYCGNYE